MMTFVYSLTKKNCPCCQVENAEEVILTYLFVYSAKRRCCKVATAVAVRSSVKIEK
jgi:hypothetical protein